MFQRHHRGYINKSTTFNIQHVIYIQTAIENRCLNEAPFFNAFLWREGCRKTRENLNTVWSCVGISEEEKIQFHAEVLNKLRRAEDEKNATTQTLQKAVIDKVKEKIKFRN